MLIYDSSCSTARLRDGALTTAWLGVELVRHLDEMAFPDVRSCLWILLCALDL